MFPSQDLRGFTCDGCGAEALFRNEEGTFGQNNPKAKPPSLQQVAESKGNFPSPQHPITTGTEKQRKRNSLYTSHEVPIHLYALLGIKMIPAHAC